MDRPGLRCSGLLTAACIGGLLAAVVAAGPAAAAGPTSGGSHGPGGPATQGAFGTVAAVAGTSMEVQNQQTGQVTVNWTSATTFTQEAAVPASWAVAGSCVTVTWSSSKGKITAQTVSISSPSPSGRCGPGAASGTPNGPEGPGAAGTAPVRISGGSPGGSGAPPAGGRVVHGRGDLGVAGGRILSVSGTRLVLSGFSSTAVGKASVKGAAGATRGRGRSGKHGGSNRPQVVTVVLSSTTTYTETRPAAAAQLAVGDCVAANGPSASNGSITAKAVQITATGGRSCTTGSGFRAPGGGSAGSRQVTSG